MFNLVDLTGKKIVLTGASQGIGRDTAIMLSKLGAKMVLIARNEAKLQETLSMLEGEGHQYYLLDINELGNIEACIKNIVNDVGPVDGLVYAAGINNDRPLQLFKPDVVSNVLNVNLGGFIEIIRCLTKKKNFNSGMRIVGVSSTSAIKGTKAHVAYSASKAGMDGAVRCLAKELSEKGICVNTVAPGMIRTAMYYKYLDGNGGVEGNLNKGLLSRQYLGIGEAQDVAAAIAFLLSESARFITGISLPVDGGLTTN